MTKHPTFIRATARVYEARDILRSLEIRHLPVVNEDREIVGMISDRDLHDPGDTEVRVAEVMTSNVISVEEEDDITDAVDLMLENKIGAVPVVNAEGVLVGIISYVDALRAARFE